MLYHHILDKNII